MKLALVIGSASCWMDDAETAMAMAKFDAVCCIKRAGIHWPYRFHVWATLHPEFQPDFEDRRRRLGFPGGHEVVCPPDSELGTAGKNQKADRRVSYRYKGMNASGGSGLYGAKVMIDDGFKVVLAGCPMTEEPHFLKHETWGTDAWKGVSAFMAGFENMKPYLLSRCKSMSGKTREILGAPSIEWLTEGRQTPA